MKLRYAVLALALTVVPVHCDFQAELDIIEGRTGYKPTGAPTKEPTFEPTYGKGEGSPVGKGKGSKSTGKGSKGKGKSTKGSNGKGGAPYAHSPTYEHTSEPTTEPTYEPTQSHPTSKSKGKGYDDKKLESTQKASASSAHMASFGTTFCLSVISLFIIMG